MSLDLMGDKGLKPLASTCKHPRTERDPGCTDTGNRYISYRCTACQEVLLRLFLDGPRHRHTEAAPCPAE